MDLIRAILNRKAAAAARRAFRDETLREYNRALAMGNLRKAEAMIMYLRLGR